MSFFCTARRSTRPFHGVRAFKNGFQCHFSHEFPNSLCRIGRQLTWQECQPCYLSGLFWTSMSSPCRHATNILVPSSLTASDKSPTWQPYEAWPSLNSYPHVHISITHHRGRKIFGLDKSIHGLITSVSEISPKIHTWSTRKNSKSMACINQRGPSYSFTQFSLLSG